MDRTAIFESCKQAVEQSVCVTVGCCKPVYNVDGKGSGIDPEPAVGPVPRYG